MWRDKISSYVDYPLENFNIDDQILKESPFVNAKTRNNYNLYAVSNHSGTMDGGHYTAICKHSTINKWFKYDDSDVSVLRDSIVSPLSYILFYSKV